MVQLDPAGPRPGRILLVSRAGLGERRCQRLAEELRACAEVGAVEVLVPDGALEVGPRSRQLGEAVDGFAPDLIVVDGDPVGPDGELWLPFLRYVAARRRPRLVLTMEDVVGRPEQVDAHWRELDAWRAVDWLYDRVVVFANRGARTTATDLALHRRITGQVQHVGYLATGGLERAVAEILDVLDQPTGFRPAATSGPLAEAGSRRV